MWPHGSAVPDLRRLYAQDVNTVNSEASRSPATAHSVDQAHACSSKAVGWGGQPLADGGGNRISFFGRNRNRTVQQRHRTNQSRSEHISTDVGLQDARSLGLSVVLNQQDVMSIEDIAQLIRCLGKAEPLPDRVFRALHHLDSRAMALLLKDLAKAGLNGRCVDLFDFLRRLPDRHVLRPLCDVYTYTAAISVCNHQHSLDRAMELFNEMRLRGIERNVHTYTALMNVCIKCGKLATALDVFSSMQSEGCTPNVVTYNTLIDVHGKLGQVDRALNIIQHMKAEGVQPALRTYNTLIIACNLCNQPREALSVYQQLKDSGFEANSTTYNALISAYGKMGQLDRVLEVYKEMVWKGLERSVITYSSLISACEKAGQWETAMRLFEDMQKDGCTPNTVSYNSLITACGQGAQWEKARQMFEQMQSRGCAPDVVTYTALISALERGGQWQLAMEAFQQMIARGCEPDAIVYNAIIDALWQTGLVWAQAKARELYGMAVKQGHFRNEHTAADGSRVELNLHALTAGVAMLSLHKWLQDIERKVLTQGEQSLPQTVVIVTDAGHASKEQGNFIIKEAVSAMMAFWGAPFRAVQDRMYLCVLETSGAQLAQWVCTDSFKAHMAALLPTAADGNGSAEQLAGQREYVASTQCCNAYNAVKSFEANHSLMLQNMGPQYLQQRGQLISSLLEKGSKLGLSDEVIHDSVLLLDRAASTSAQMPLELQQLLAAAALHLSINQEATPDSTQHQPAAVAGAFGVDANAMVELTWRLQQLLKGDTVAFSTMRCLKVYMERTGCRYLDKQGIYITAGLPVMLAVEALFDMSLLNCRPSVVAAALMYADRRQRGAVPFWPSALAKMTGYEDLNSSELACAVRTAQKLCKAALYTQVYKQQSVSLAQQVAARQSDMAVALPKDNQAPFLASPSSTVARTVSCGSSTSGSLCVPAILNSMGYITGAGGPLAVMMSPSTALVGNGMIVDGTAMPGMMSPNIASVANGSIVDSSAMPGVLGGALAAVPSGVLTAAGNAGTLANARIDQNVLVQQHLQVQQQQYQLQQQQQLQLQHQHQLQQQGVAMRYLTSTLPADGVLNLASGTNLTNITHSLPAIGLGGVSSQSSLTPLLSQIGTQPWSMLSIAPVEQTW